MNYLSRIFGTDGAPKETATQQAIRKADTARDRRDWFSAATHYRSALREDDAQPHIWIQLGHALKESGRLDDALQAYQEATTLAAADADAHLHLAHLYKRLGYIDPAIRHFLLSIHYGTDSKAEEHELLALMAQQVERGEYAKIAAAVEALDAPPPGKDAPILSKLRAIVASRGPAAAAPASPADPTLNLAMVFDVSDLIGFWRASRLPTGIQRVQIEAIMGALQRENGRAIRLCCFTSLREDWLEVPVASFRRLCALATTAGATDDDDWTEAVAELDLQLTLTPPFVFPHGALLINLGTSWWLQNYFLFVRQAKKTRGIRYIPFVHDMIPIIAPEHCIEGLTQDFISWALGVFDHADHFLVNSRATAKDLRTVAKELGHTITPDNIAIVPLDSDFRKSGLRELEADALDQWQLEDGGFVLFVSTVESRKGHLVAFAAWAELIARLGPDKVPQLVCVGNRGWLNDKVYERLATDLSLSRKVTMLSGLSDAELALLYRSCRFTIYPSFYEGWGLPVTESLSYGKVPLISDAASLPEAGGRFAVSFAAGNQAQLVEKAEKLISDDAYRARLEAVIRAEFKPRSWPDLAGKIIAELDHFAAIEDSPQGTDLSSQGAHLTAPKAIPGNWYSLVRNRSIRIWPGMSTAEKFRSNLGWHWPEDRGCRVRKGGGDLTMQVEPIARRLRVYIGLRGDEAVRAGYRISLGDQVQEGWLEPDEIVWVWFDMAANEWSGEQTIAFGAVIKPNDEAPTYFVRGFFLCLRDEPEMREDFLEAVSLGRLDRLNAYRETKGQSQKR
ncbi:glycosyltransferase family 4 protein [Novosphingobium aquimarinum]|uniref:glycosyltransferase family 4 protein n=1 Tax=Novosphingobium aquimarinum TaxID=2682494 RepID=UPI0012EC496A|nr:glycosyltransferase family 1 protein [Novosphingobium aquimarinum]